MIGVLKMRLIVLLFGLMSVTTNSMAETAEKPGWRVGLDFEQQVYMRQGLRLEKVSEESGSSLGVTLGSQSAASVQADGTRNHRKVVDFGAYYLGRRSIAQDLNHRLGLQIGQMSFHNGANTSTTSGWYFDVIQGLAVSYGKVDFFTDVAFRYWALSPNKDMQIGDRKLESNYVYPRLGFNIAI